MFDAANEFYFASAHKRLVWLQAKRKNHPMQLGQAFERKTHYSVFGFAVKFRKQIFLEVRTGTSKWWDEQKVLPFAVRFRMKIKFIL